MWASDGLFYRRCTEGIYVAAIDRSAGSVNYMPKLFRYWLR
jgi:hypothetical protein